MRPEHACIQVSAQRPGASFAIEFSRRTGLPNQITTDGIRRLHSPMLPNFWRPLNDNELGSKQASRLSKWRSSAAWATYRRP